MNTREQRSEVVDLNMGLIAEVAPCARHHTLLKSYLLNLHRGPASVKDLIVHDFRSCMDIGAHRVAEDLLVVLRLFLKREEFVAA